MRTLSKVLLVGLLSITARADDFLIVPGKGFGPFGPALSLARMEKMLPPGQFMSGDHSVSLWAMEPSKRINLRLDGEGKIRTMSVHGTSGVWHTASGVHLGMSLLQLEQVNGGPFKFRSLGTSEDAGRILDWQGGKLARPFARVRLTLASAFHAPGYSTLNDEEHAMVEKAGLSVGSDDPLARKLNPLVETLELSF